MGVLSEVMSVYHMHAWFLRRPEESIRSPGAIVKEGCKPPYGARNQI